MTQPDLDPTWARGLDASYAQGTVDWASVTRQSYSFAFVKATEGITLTDPQFSANWAGTQKAGLLRGAYHYYHPDDDPQEQAEFFLNTVWPEEGSPWLGPMDLPPVLDIETTDGQSLEEVVQGIEAWLSRVQQATERTPILYTNRGFWDTLGIQQFGTYPLWVAEYGVIAPSPLPAGWQEWQLWQYSQSGSVEGIGAPVDLDVFQGTLEELQQVALTGFVASP